MASILTCAGCKGQIVGRINKYHNNLYCEHCYNEVIEAEKKAEQEKADLYSFIKTLFSVEEIPFSVIGAIDKLLAEGKKISGIRGTLVYYYQIKGNSVDEISYLGLVVKREYENAATYFAQAKHIKEVNATIDINVPPVVVVLPPSDDRKKKKQKYKMEDL